MKVDRLMSIILILLDKKRISAQELADTFEVSLRTIYRDIDAIDLAGIPIRAISGVGGGFEIMPNYKLDHKVFSPADLSAILTGLSSVSGMIQSDELIHALAKVKSFIPEKQAKEIEVKVNQISIDFSQWMGNTNIQPYLEIVKTALQESRLVSFVYIAHHGNTSKRIVEPCQLVLKSSHWYLYGFCREKKDMRLFRLSRMAELTIQEETCIQKEVPKPQLEVTDLLSTMQREITLRIHASIMDRVLDFCSYDHFSFDGNEYYIVRFPFIENDYYYDILLSFGSKCECLAPLHVRTEVKRRIQEIALIYV